MSISTRPSYTLVPGRRTSVDVFVSVYTRTFTQPLFDALFPGRATDPAGYRAYVTRSQARSFEDKDVFWAMVVAKPPISGDSAPTADDVGEEGEVVAVGKWKWCSGDKPKEEAQKSEDEWVGKDREFSKLFLGELAEAQQRIMADRPHFSEQSTFPSCFKLAVSSPCSLSLCLPS